jgi:hypothetical protein
MHATGGNPRNTAPRRRRGSTRVVIVAAVAAVALGTLGYVGYRWMRQSPAATEDFGDVADTFLQQVRSGRVDDAWQSTTAEFKSAMGKETFRRFVKTNPALSAPAERTGFQNVTANRIRFGEYTYRATPNKPADQAKIRVWIAREQGEWRVDRVFVE